MGSHCHAPTYFAGNRSARTDSRKVEALVTRCAVTEGTNTGLPAPHHLATGHSGAVQYHFPTVPPPPPPYRAVGAVGNKRSVPPHPVGNSWGTWGTRRHTCNSSPP